MSERTLPLMSISHPDAPLVRHRGRVISNSHFLRQAGALARILPEGEYAVNLCEDRYHFFLAFVALLLRGQANLLPANRSQDEVESVSSRYGNCLALVDQKQPRLTLEQFVIEPDTLQHGPGMEIVPQLSAAQLCAVVFTSGSTGQSQPWEKYWGELYEGAFLTRQMLGLEEEGLSVVATVPPQHMFGLETTIVLPLVCGLAVDAGRPFFPYDLQATLKTTPEPRVLVSTPVHLKACLEAGIEQWPTVARIVSATAPLAQQQAERAEQVFGGALQEIYGSTETGAIATRRTRKQALWRLHRGVHMEQVGAEGECVSVYGGHLRTPVVLNDRIVLDEPGTFRLLGRNSDMLKIAGKRVSLADLNHKLLALPGVEDGVFFPPVEHEAESPRLSAAVVAPGQSRKTILEALKQRVDPLCLPRPLYLVDRLPRNESGKLPREALDKLRKELGRR